MNSLLDHSLVRIERKVPEGPIHAGFSTYGREVWGSGGCSVKGGIFGENISVQKWGFKTHKE